ncbi:MAG: HAMP domain-containing sensor histidine kinase [Nocardioides sp.]|uniref:sensor histidine kinase n=1 Tax=Nocardioides sp. TaxID=35761 RepID=UPI0039E41E3F
MVTSRRRLRFRLTCLYGGLFLVSSLAVLGITYLVVDHLTADTTAYVGPDGAGGQVGSGSSGSGDRSERRVNGDGDASRTARRAAQQARELKTLADRQHRHLLHQLLLGSGIAMGAMSLVSVGLGWVVAGRVLGPLRTMTARTQHITEHNLNERLALGGPEDELKQLGDTIDALLARLEAAFDAQRRFVAHVSHELRTPLTMIRTAVDVDVGKPGAGPGVARLAGRVRPGLDRADTLVEGFLDLARAEYAGVTATDAVPIEPLIRSAIEANTETIAVRRLDVAAPPCGPALRGDPRLLRQLVGNLIGNAVTHNHDAGWVRVSVDADHGAGIATLVVDNSGPRLDPPDLPGLLQPFRQAGANRHDTGGVGLGLSIVAAVARAHHGDVLLRARPEGGLHVEVSLPLTATDPSRSGGGRPRRGEPT